MHVIQVPKGSIRGRMRRLQGRIVPNRVSMPQDSAEQARSEIAASLPVRGIDDGLSELADVMARAALNR